MKNNHSYLSNTPHDRALRSLGEEIVKYRKLYRIKQREFSERIGLDPAQLCKLEKGRHLPSNEILDKIEEVLNLRQGMLQSIRESVKRLSHVSPYTFTVAERLIPTYSGHSIPADDLLTLKERVCPILDEYAELECQIQIPSNCRLSLGSMSARSWSDGIDAAEAFRSILGAEASSLVSLLPNLERSNFRVIPVDDLPPVIDKNIVKRRDAFALHDRLYDNVAICVNGKSEPYAQLYDIAYEIGSYLRYRRFCDSGLEPRTSEDRFCRAFASTLLMPEIEIRELIDELNISNDNWSMRLMDDLAVRFGVSSRAFLWRLKSIHRISEHLFEAFDQQLKNPATFETPSFFVPRPPLQFNRWLNTLRLRARTQED